MRRARRPAGAVVLPGARIADGVALAVAAGGSLVVGADAVLGPGCRIDVGPGARVVLAGVLAEGCRIVARAGVVVEPGARLGPECVLIDCEADPTDPERPTREQPLRTAPILVGAGAELGPGVVIGPGARIQAGERVLAHSVLGGS